MNQVLSKLNMESPKSLDKSLNSVSLKSTIEHNVKSPSPVFLFDNSEKNLNLTLIFFE